MIRKNPMDVPTILQCNKPRGEEGKGGWKARQQMGPQGHVAQNSWARGQAHARINRRAHMGSRRTISGLTLLTLYSPLSGVKRICMLGRADGDSMAWWTNGVRLSPFVRGLCLAPT
ncbi:hypothetical protein TIFTF001_028614 [Ficus carica]|uniref:Uncharacterized protein n=1 Tax=Ficus carica TaxID=3494 RepID=A0AA88DQ40_FICCA|nr:hypothetical protein TIFTF001_028614 [Ficus carica]